MNKDSSLYMTLKVKITIEENKDGLFYKAELINKSESNKEVLATGMGRRVNTSLAIAFQDLANQHRKVARHEPLI